MGGIFEQRLRAARESRKMSQGELAEKAGFQPSAISHFETGSRSPSFDNLKRLADALTVTTDYLLGRVDQPTLSGPSVGKVFRHAENLTADDLQALENMAEALAKKSQGLDALEHPTNGCRKVRPGRGLRASNRLFAR